MRLWRRPTRVVGPPVPPPEGKPDAYPAVVVAGLERDEKVLATAREDEHGHWLVLTTWRLLERTAEGEAVLDVPWLAVDTGAWDPDAWALSVSFVDGGSRRWVLQRRTGPGQVPQVFRDRTTASVVLMRQVDLGPRRTARVTIRKDLRTRELHEQVLLGRGARREDRDLMSAVLIARQELRGQVGMDPVDGVA